MVLSLKVKNKCEETMKYTKIVIIGAQNAYNSASRNVKKNVPDICTKNEKVYKKVNFSNGIIYKERFEKKITMSLKEVKKI